MSDIKQKAREWYGEWLNGDYGFDFNEYLADKVQEVIDLAITEERNTTLKEIEEECEKMAKEISDASPPFSSEYDLSDFVSLSDIKQLIHQKLIK